MIIFANSGIESAVNIVGYLTLFVGVGLAFVFINLLVGHFVRPATPSPEKGEIYECGEPSIGSSYIQFDLRFYIVALLFIIFDVEVAFFFPFSISPSTESSFFVLCTIILFAGSMNSFS